MSDLIDAPTEAARQDDEGVHFVNKHSIESGFHPCGHVRLSLVAALSFSASLSACGDASPESIDKPTSTVAASSGAATTEQMATSTTVDAYAAEYEVFCAELVRRLSSLNEERFSPWETYLSLWGRVGDGLSDFELGSMFQLEDKIRLKLQGIETFAPSISAQRVRAEEYANGANDILDRLDREVRESKRAAIQRELDAYYANAPDQPFVAGIPTRCDLPEVDWWTLIPDSDVAAD